jgi:hypothetical protein
MPVLPTNLSTLDVIDLAIETLSVLEYWLRRRAFYVKQLVRLANLFARPDAVSLLRL